MEWGKRENRIAVVALFKVGKNAIEIFEILKPLKITKRFVYRAIKLFTETGDVEDRPRSGRPKTVRTPQAIKAVEARIRRNPLRKQKVMSREMHMSTRSMSRLIKSDLGMSAYRRSTGHLLTPALMDKRHIRAKELLKKYGDGKHRRILFTDEKIFTIEEHFNKQNDRVYATSSKKAREVVGKVQRGHHPSSVMVWWGVSYEGTTNLHFCTDGVKTSAKTYQTDVLEEVVRPLNATLFQTETWVFQQDSAPAHKARTTQRWLEHNVPEFIKHTEWPSASPDLNPLDYKLWSVLEEMACSKRHANVDSLKASLTKAHENFPMDVVRSAIDEWPDRLKACAKARGGHFE